MAEQRSREDVKADLCREIIDNFGKGRETELYQAAILEVLLDIRELLQEQKQAQIL